MLFLWSYPRRRTPQALEIKKQIMNYCKLSEYKDLTIFFANGVALKVK
jgi:hypothetical protein